MPVNPPSPPESGDRPPWSAPAPDDTQPIKPVQIVPESSPPGYLVDLDKGYIDLGDTRPTLSIKPRSPGALRHWLIVLLAAVMIPLAGWLLWPSNNETVHAITVHDGSEIMELTGKPGTVADFLETQNINLEAGDIITPGLTARLNDGMVINIERARTVNLTVDGRTSLIRTVYDYPYDILNTSNIEIGPADEIMLDGLRATATDLILWPLPVDEIVIQHAVPILIVDGDEEHMLYTTGETIGDALYDAGITLFLADTVHPDINASLTPDMTINIERASPITIIADGERLESRVNGQTVGDALAEAGIALNGLDYAMPSEAQIVQPGMRIRVIRVHEEIITETEDIPYEHIFQPDAERLLDTRAIIQAGQTGELERVQRVRYENDVEISRAIESETRTREPVNQITAYGTNIVLRMVDTPEGPRQYWRKLRMYATSYYGEALGSYTTSIGRRLTKGIIAIDPRIVPYNTNMYVPGYGLGEAADTGGPRSTPYWVDLGYDDDNYRPWSRWVTVYLLEPIPESVDYLLPRGYNGGPITD